jgi:hypothetical protein
MRKAAAVAVNTVGVVLPILALGAFVLSGIINGGRACPGK